MRKIYGILLVVMLVCVGCQWQLRTSDADAEVSSSGIQRFDRIESLYLTTGDVAAMQQLNTNYPMQTRMLMEDVLHLGPGTTAAYAAIANEGEYIEPSFYTQVLDHDGNVILDLQNIPAVNGNGFVEKKNVDT